MAVLFSHVRVSTPAGNEAEFLVSGIPREFEDFDYDDFDSKEVCKQVDEETAELFNDICKMLHQAVAKCVVQNVDEFID